jgi:type VI secretion system protein ImpJ
MSPSTSMARVVWHEGMHLAQQTFQAHSRYFEDSIRFVVSHLFVAPYGLAGLDLDAAALQNGTVSLLHARGVMPDGLPFHIPQGDAPPPPLDIRESFSPTQDSQLLLLTIPSYQPGQANCSLAPGETLARRYVAESGEVPDDITGSDKRAVTFARKNFQLALEGAPLTEGVVTLPIARVRRDGAGHFMFDPEYVPPCLQLGASPRLLEILQRLVEMLDAKSGALRAGRAQDQGAGGRGASGDVATFWLAHAVHSALAPLRHHLHAKHGHPERLYVELARLAGALCTFALDAHPETLPAYDHEHLGECFTALDRHIRANLEIIVPTGYVTIPLRRSAQYLLVGAIQDKRCLGPAVWFLGVRSSIGDAELMRSAPQLIKVCSQKHIVRLVKEAYPGLTLEHVATPPSAIAPRGDMRYFSVIRSGPCWDAIAKSEDLGVYVPDGIRDAELELRVLLDV